MNLGLAVRARAGLVGGTRCAHLAAPGSALRPARSSTSFSLPLPWEDGARMQLAWAVMGRPACASSNRQCPAPDDGRVGLPPGTTGVRPLQWGPHCLLGLRHSHVAYLEMQAPGAGSAVRSRRWLAEYPRRGEGGRRGDGGKSRFGSRCLLFLCASERDGQGLCVSTFFLQWGGAFASDHVIGRPWR